MLLSKEMILPLSSLYRFLLCLLCGLAPLREKIPIETAIT